MYFRMECHKVNPYGDRAGDLSGLVAQGIGQHGNPAAGDAPDQGAAYDEAIFLHHPLEPVCIRHRQGLPGGRGSRDACHLAAEVGHQEVAESGKQIPEIREQGMATDRRQLSAPVTPGDPAKQSLRVVQKFMDMGCGGIGQGLDQVAARSRASSTLARNAR